MLKVEYRPALIESLYKPCAFHILIHVHVHTPVYTIKIDNWEKFEDSQVSKKLLSSVNSSEGPSNSGAVCAADAMISDSQWTALEDSRHRELFGENLCMPLMLRVCHYFPPHAHGVPFFNFQLFLRFSAMCMGSTYTHTHSCDHCAFISAALAWFSPCCLYILGVGYPF